MLSTIFSDQGLLHASQGEQGVQDEVSTHPDFAWVFKGVSDTAIQQTFSDPEPRATKYASQPPQSHCRGNVW